MKMLARHLTTPLRFFVVYPLAVLFTVTCMLAAPAPASSQLLLTGVGGGGFGGYVPNAILTTPTFSPQIAAAGLSNAATFVLYTEFRCLPGTTALAPDNYQGCNNSITFGNYLDAAGDAEHNPGLNFVAQDSFATGGTSRFNLNNCTGGNNNSALAVISGINAIYADGKMHSLLWYGDFTQTSSSGVRAGAVYLDGAQVVAGFTDQGTFSGTKTVCFNANPFYLNAFNATQASKNVEFGRFYLYINPPSSPVQTGTNTASFNLANFGTAATPVDFGATGANPLASAPTVFFCNPAATYLTNCNGSGPNATAQQQVTSAATLKAYDAAIRPGEVPDRPWVKGHYNVTWNTLACISTALTCTAGTNGGWAVDVGDLVCWVIDIGNTADAANDAFAMSGYTNVTGGTVVGTGLASSLNYNINMAMFCKTYTGTAIPSGGTIATPTFTWTDNSGGMGPFGGFQVEGNITFINFGKFGSGVTPSISAATGLGGPNGTTTLPFGDVNAPSGKSLWVGIQADSQWAASPSLGAIGPPATGTLVVGAAPLVQNNAPTMYVEKLSAAGTIARTAAGNPGNPTASISVVLN